MVCAHESMDYIRGGPLLFSFSENIPYAWGMVLLVRALVASPPRDAPPSPPTTGIVWCLRLARLGVALFFALPTQ